MHVKGKQNETSKCTSNVYIVSVPFSNPRIFSSKRLAQGFVNLNGHIAGIRVFKSTQEAPTEEVTKEFPLKERFNAFSLLH